MLHVDNFMVILILHCSYHYFLHQSFMVHIDNLMDMLILHWCYHHYLIVHHINFMRRLLLGVCSDVSALCSIWRDIACVVSCTAVCNVQEKQCHIFIIKEPNSFFLLAEPWWVYSYCSDDRSSTAPDCSGTTAAASTAGTHHRDTAGNGVEDATVSISDGWNPLEDQREIQRAQPRR